MLYERGNFFYSSLLSANGKHMSAVDAIQIGYANLLVFGIYPEYMKINTIYILLIAITVSHGLMGDQQRRPIMYHDLYKFGKAYQEKLQVTPAGAAAINEINDQESVRWLVSFLSVDKTKTFCLYEATSAESIRKAAERARIPADVIIEVGEEILPSGDTQKLRVERFG